VLGRVIRPTAKTARCSICDLEGFKAALAAEDAAQLESIRRWLRAAPVYPDDLLATARAADPGPVRAENPGGPPTSSDPWYDIARHLDAWGAPRSRPVPWVDTMELDVAAGFLHYATRGGSEWPPATEDARLRLRGSPESNPATRLDIGAAFGQRGFPFPPDETRRHLRMWDGDYLVEEVGDSGIEVWADLSHLGAAVRAGGHAAMVELLTALRGGEPPTGHSGAEVLPVDYADALELRLRLKPTKSSASIHDYLRWYEGVVLWTAVGSVFRDAEGRVVVLWC
jgi:hypothetical protein